MIYAFLYMLYDIHFVIYALQYKCFMIYSMIYSLWYILYDIHYIIRFTVCALRRSRRRHFLFTWTFSLQTSHLGLWTIKTRLDCTQIVVGFLPLNTSAVKAIFEIELAWGLCSCSKCVIKIQHNYLVWKWFFKTFSTEGKITYFNVSFQGYKYSIAPWE